MRLIVALWAGLIGLTGCANHALPPQSAQLHIPTLQDPLPQASKPQASPSQDTTLQSAIKQATTEVEADFSIYLLTPTEAKTHACPQSVSEVGASEEDCDCAEETLLLLGQDGERLYRIEAGTTQVENSDVLTDIKPRRVTAIEILRIDAFEACGFFDAGHSVGAGL